MRRFLLRFANLFRAGRAEREMSREIEAHLTLLQEDFERGGMPPEEARLAAKREYGGVEQAKELHRAERSFVWIEQIFKDVRYGWINLLRNPGFTLTAVIALALGIGVNATVFGVYNAVALKPLPIADPDHVVRIERWFASNGARHESIQLRLSRVSILARPQRSSTRSQPWWQQARASRYWRRRARGRRRSTHVRLCGLGQLLQRSWGEGTPRPHVPAGRRSCAGSEPGCGPQSQLLATEISGRLQQSSARRIKLNGLAYTDRRGRARGVQRHGRIPAGDRFLGATSR